MRQLKPDVRDGGDGTVSQRPGAPRGGGRGSGRQNERVRKSQVLGRHSASGVRSIADAVVIKDGEPFFLCPPDGQISLAGDDGYGLYHHDTRFLCGYEVEIAGTRPNPLAAVAVSGNVAVLELTMPELHLPDGRSVAKERLAVHWTRELDAAGPRLRDRIEIRSYDDEAVRLPIRLEFAAGFEDVFDVRGLLRLRPGRLEGPRWRGDRLEFRYDGRDGVDRTLSASIRPASKRRGDSGFELELEVPARGSDHLEVVLEIDEQLEPGARPIERRMRGGGSTVSAAAAHPRTRAQAHQEPLTAGGGDWPTTIETDSIALQAIMARSLEDLVTLRGELDGQRYYAAGLPWFSTLFGRDSLITAYQTLAFDPRVAEETLRLLAGRQGATDDEFRDEQPGRILHELRIGELARLGEIPHTPYYGSIDATPLFLILLARQAAWTGSLDLFHELRSNVERALAWLDGDADPTGRGFVAYESDVDRGLVNQGWKDSGDAIVDADGRLAEPPIALAEVQGYAYAARRDIAELFERDGDTERTASLRREAEALRGRFEAAFWSDELGCYTLALARDGRPCRVATSNAGQVLWSGIASEDHARRVAERLVQDDLFSGWGIRTLSAKARAFNPIGYHLGTVWPHDNGLIADGFRRYGLDDEAERLFVALVEAATDFPQQRLPECFAGYPRNELGIPVRYPIACHPQAWAAGAIPHLLTTNLGIVAEAFDGRLRIVRPRLPHFVDQLAIRGMRVGKAAVDLSFRGHHDATEVSVDRVEGDLDVRVEAG